MIRGKKGVRLTLTRLPKYPKSKSRSSSCNNHPTGHTTFPGTLFCWRKDAPTLSQRTIGAFSFILLSCCPFYWDVQLNESRSDEVPLSTCRLLSIFPHSSDIQCFAENGAKGCGIGQSERRVGNNALGTCSDIADRAPMTSG